MNTQLNTDLVKIVSTWVYTIFLIFALRLRLYILVKTTSSALLCSFDEALFFQCMHSKHRAQKLHILCECHCLCHRCRPTKVQEKTNTTVQVRNLRNSSERQGKPKRLFGLATGACGCGKTFRYLSSLPRHQRGCEKK